MKRISIFFVLSIIVLASCERENIENPSALSNEGLNFSISDSDSQGLRTKSSVLLPSNGTVQDDIVISLRESNASSFYDHEVTTKGTPIEDVQTLLDSVQYMKVWNWNDGSKICPDNPQKCKKKGSRYIPVDASDNYKTIIISDIIWSNPVFYALAPETPVGNLYNINASTTNLKFNYTLPAPNTSVNCDAQAQRDFVTGLFSGEESDLSNNTVPLNFSHPLAALRFKVGDVGQDITINSISLIDVNSTGYCTITSSTGAIVWSSQGTPKTYVQVFNQDVTTSTPEGTEINDDARTKTFFVIPSSYLYSKTAKIELSYTKAGIDKKNSFSLNLTNWEADKVYEYTIDVMDKPWVDFANTSWTGGRGFRAGELVFNKSFRFKFVQENSCFEKINVPIRNLEAGAWYEFTFAECFDTGEWPESDGSHWNAQYGEGAYNSGILETIPTSTAMSSIITLYNGDDSQSRYKYFWAGSEGVNAYTASSLEKSSPIKICFYATAQTMYWVTETSKFKDGLEDMFLKVYEIKEIPVPSTPAVDYLNAELYGFYHALNDSKTGFSAFKTYAKDGTASVDGEMELHGLCSSSNYEKFNIPLINLEVGKSYTLTFTYCVEVGNKNTKDTFGYCVADAMDTNVSAVNPNAIDKSSQMTKGVEYDESITFTATASTMYLTWDVSRLNDNYPPCVMKFSKTRINETL